MIATVLLSILIFSVSAGENVTIPVNETAVLQADDSCMYFLESMSNVANVPPGEHKLQIGLMCSEGIKVVTANGSRIAAISVSPAKPEIVLKYAIYLENEIKNVWKNYSLLSEEVNKLSERVNALEQENSKLKTEKLSLETELRAYKDSYDQLQSKYSAISQDLESKKNRISQMEIELKNLSEQSTTYRITTFFLVSIFIGSFTATAIMIRRP